MSAFKPATRHAVKLKLGLMGPSGSGKTYSADRLAAGLCPGGKIAFLDTENGSASLYADRFAFDVLDMHAPFTVQKFLAAMDDAIKAGYDCLIIDSISAEWQELLAEKELLDGRGGNSFTNWGSITKKHEDFKKAFVQAPIHIIACMRSKQEYVLQTNDKGKQAPVKVGMGAVQREGFEYECSVVFDIDMSHHAKTSKDRTSLFGDEIFQITEETGKALREWLSKGGAPAPEPAPAPAAKDQLTTLGIPALAMAADVPGLLNQIEAAITQKDPAWVDAMAQLAAVTLGMPEKTRTKLVEHWESEGPSAVAELLKEIDTIRSTQVGTTAKEVISTAQAEAIARQQPVSTAAARFVDELDPDLDEDGGGINEFQYLALGSMLDDNGVNRDAFRAYAAKAGHLLPGKNGPTLARLKAEKFNWLREKLADNRIASKGETWSQRTVRTINATPTTTFNPPTAA